MKTKVSSRTVFIAIVAALGGILFGYDTAVISGTTEVVKMQFGLTTGGEGWYVGCALIGSILGVLIAGMMSDFMGRKKTMLISALLFSISAIGCAVSQDFTQLVIFRIVGGFGIGIVSIVSPVYISEVSPAEVRGTMVSLYQLFITIGFLLAYLANYLILKGTSMPDYWRPMLGAEAAVAAPLLASACKPSDKDRYGIELDSSVKSKLIVEKANALPITGTFLDEISHDIPHQNWGEAEWDRDFRYMKDMGIDTVIDIRCGYRKFITYPSPYLLKKGCYMPSVDLIDMFCRLAQKYGMKFWLGLYDSGKYWDTGDMSYEVEANKFVIDEIWERYGSKYSSFGGWYISGEISRATKGAIESFRTMGRQCKEVSGGLPTFISPWIDGKKAVDAASGNITREQAVGIEQHEREWNEIFDGIHEYVDACAFQDGHIDYDELDAFFSVNKKLADRYGMQCWTNAESFDRDMPIRFFPIKFDKLRLKLEAAKRCGYDKAITFEFSHFMSPQSAYAQAGHLYDRYREYFGI